MSQTARKTEADEDERFLRTEFLERVAHELRGPAGVTLGALDELELELAHAASPRMLQLLAMARRGARRVLRTADRLSRTAQLESGGVGVTAFPVDVRGIVTRATLDASETEGRASIEVTTEVPEDACMAAADSGWLGAAVGEMVGQAIRAASKRVHVAVVREDQAIWVGVTDDRATHLDVTRTRFASHGSRRDTGLDMPLVLDVARMHGHELEIGELRVVGEGDRGGTRIRLRLDAAR